MVIHRIGELALPEDVDDHVRKGLRGYIRDLNKVEDVQFPVETEILSPPVAASTKMLA